jgi:hypothetical protein
MTESTIMTPDITATPKKSGRPPTVGQRQHLFLSSDVRDALQYCSDAMDAVGPSEVIRAALMHCRNAMLAVKKRVDVVAQTGSMDISLCARLRKEADASDVPMSSNPKMHITMTPATSELLTKVAKTSGLTSPSATVGLAVLMFADYMEAVKRGECVVFANSKGGVIAGYSPWLDEAEIRALL